MQDAPVICSISLKPPTTFLPHYLKLLIHLYTYFSLFPSCSIEGEYVPVEGDEVTYKVSRVPPKNLKVQAVEVKITHLNPGTKHETWSGQIISS